jgi:hypothetical protein
VLRFGVCPVYTPSYENEFIDVETFSDIVPEVRETPVDSAVAAMLRLVLPKLLLLRMKLLQSLPKIWSALCKKSCDIVENPSLIENREEIPDDQDPSPSVTAYNKSFGTSFRGELLSVRGEVVDTDDGVPKFSLLWTSPEFVGETRGDAPKKRLWLTGRTTYVAEKHTSSSLSRNL